MFVWQSCGWCTNGTQCPLSHDTDLIIFQDEKGTKGNRKKRKREQEKKGGGANVAPEDPSIFDRAPENKVPHMEVDDAPDDQQRSGSLTDSEKDNQQERGGDNTDHRKSATSDEDTNTNTATADERKRSPDQSADSPKKNTDTGLHRAGFDAFMTGFIFAYSCTVTKKDGVGDGEHQEQEGEQALLPSCLNKVYLSRKTAPLNVVKSSFTKSSKAHLKKMELVWGERV